MSKLEEILAELDNGGDRDVKWSARSGDAVLLFYENGAQIRVTAQYIVPEPSDAGSES